MDEFDEVLVDGCLHNENITPENLAHNNDAISLGENDNTTTIITSQSSDIPASEDLHDLEDSIPPAAVQDDLQEQNTDQSTDDSLPPPEYTEHDSNRPCYDCTCCYSPCWSKRCLGKSGITWIITIVLSFVLALIVKVVVFAPYSFNSSPSDQIEIHTFPSTYFCESIQIESTSVFTTFFLLFPPTVDQNDQPHYQDMVTFGIAAGDFSYWGFYMLEGSDINLEVCTSESAEVFIFKGQSNFNTFQTGCLENKCPSLFSQVINSQSCNGSTNRTTITIYDTEQDYYFIVVSARSSEKTVPGTVYIDLTRSVYNIASIGDSVCVSETSCLMTGTEATFGVLFVAPSDSEYNAYNAVKCYADYRTYLFIFVVIPVMIAVVVCVSVVLKAKQVRDQDDTGTQTSPRTLRRVMQQLESGPPAYEELFSEEEGRAAVQLPPPYPGYPAEYPGQQEGPSTPDSSQIIES